MALCFNLLSLVFVVVKISEEERDTFSGTSGRLIGATITLFSAIQSLKHSKSQITPVALLIKIITAADSYRRVMTDDTLLEIR